MEGQALPRLQPLAMNHLNKGTHQNPNAVSPPQSPTAASNIIHGFTVVSSPATKPVPNLNPAPRQPPQVAEPQKQGWTSFDDSPVHSQPAGSAFSQESSPWGGQPSGKQWIPFANNSTKSEPEAGQTAANTGSHSLAQKTQSDEGVQQTVAAGPTRPLARPLNLASGTPVKPSQTTTNYTTISPAAVSNQQTAGPTQAYGDLSTLATQSAYANSTQPQQQVGSVEEEHATQSESHDDHSDFQDPWCITAEQREYYTKQFSGMQSDLEGKINGQSARSFFTKSKLPILELSHIWELSDMDQDGRLTLDEFCTAFHLVVARKNGYDLPSQLPQALVPTLIDISGEAERANVVDPFAPDANTQPAQALPLRVQASESKTQDQWETFSDRTSSSTTLANFDQGLDSAVAHLPHPVAMRMSPSRHHEHWTQVDNADNDDGERLKTETQDEESTTSSPQTRSKVPTNPYGYLRNELSEPDSGGDDRVIKHRTLSSSSSSGSTANAPDNQNDDKTFKKHRKTKARSRSNSSASSTTSSVATSDRSSGDENFQQKGERSDVEHSDWSSRPLRPRSGSSSSEESGPVPTLSAPPPPAPTPPPRPQAHPQTTASPMPKPRPTVKSKSNSLDSNSAKKGLQETERRIDGPTPPPRPQPAANKETPQESFADFSNFKQPSPAVSAAAKPVDPAPQSKKTPKSKSRDRQKPENVAKERVEKPVPAPRPMKEAAKSLEASDTETTKETETETPATNQKKAPIKPPRSRMLSTDVVKPDPLLTSLTISNKDEKKVARAPKQDPNRNKSALQSAIRELKNRNTQLTRLNADLQQQLKDVMETRITVEMNIHHMRPFTQ